MDMTTVSLDKKTRDRLANYKEADGRETFDHLINSLLDKVEEEN